MIIITLFSIDGSRITFYICLLSLLSEEVSLLCHLSLLSSFFHNTVLRCHSVSFSLSLSFFTLFLFLQLYYFFSLFVKLFFLFFFVSLPLSFTIFLLPSLWPTFSIFLFYPKNISPLFMLLSRFPGCIFSDSHPVGGAAALPKSTRMLKSLVAQSVVEAACFAFLFW